MEKQRWFVIFLLLMAGSLWAGRADSSDRDRTTYVPDSYSTIQDAIDAAEDGDTVVVRAGIYTGEGNANLTFRGRGIASVSPLAKGIQN